MTAATYSLTFTGHILQRGFWLYVWEVTLGEAMASAGYVVMNTVKCRKPLDAAMFEEVRAAFGVEFPGLAAAG